MWPRLNHAVNPRRWVCHMLKNRPGCDFSSGKISGRDGRGQPVGARPGSSPLPARCLIARKKTRLQEQKEERLLISCPLPPVLRHVKVTRSTTPSPSLSQLAPPARTPVLSYCPHPRPPISPPGQLTALPPRPSPAFGPLSSLMDGAPMPPSRHHRRILFIGGRRPFRACLFVPGCPPGTAA